MITSNEHYTATVTTSTNEASKMPQPSPTTDGTRLPISEATNKVRNTCPKPATKTKPATNNYPMQTANIIAKATYLH